MTRQKRKTLKFFHCDARPVQIVSSAINAKVQVGCDRESVDLRSENPSGRGFPYPELRTAFLRPQPKRCPFDFAREKEKPADR
jgi:hypothetical protein